MPEFKQESLANLSIVRNLTERLGGGIKKSFGQNFLINQKVLFRFVDLLEINENDVVLEIGPGIGVVSYTLCQRAKKVILIELDRTKEDALKKVLENFSNYEIVWGDASQIDLAKVIKELKIDSNQKIKVIGSLPYNVGKRIITNLFESNLNWDSAAFFLQKEVAEDYTAKPPHSTYLANQAAIFATSEYAFTISPKQFYPVPKVESAAIKFTRHSLYDSINKSSFAKFVRTGFTAPRKTIYNNLKSLNYDAATIEKAGVNPMKRPAELNTDDWFNLFNLKED